MIFLRRNLLWIIIAVAGTLALLSWVFFESYNINKPKPGIEALQDGREHIPHGQKVDYQFNPPTGGNHYADWITKGFFEEPRDDGSIVHSLEHGYIVINYDCERPLAFFNLISTTYAHEESTESGTVNEGIDTQGSSAMTGGSEGIPSKRSENMPEAFRNGRCDNLKNKLRDFYNSNQHKLIIQPREKMDAPIILTAWGRMLKLNNFDENQIKEFYKALKDQGPERTVEP